ncbi:MAG: hypothetical protein COU25_02655 [Candidatus Levybacteria bacterium CG10_big_fil_rev_8_21_14_0_10_35_13]|nr:MAG: hypothetical protein COU25_02655 [Candidatus Levybacteria bacterium CG10_big_fil_rev_8_21_14_0_10_35_13]
MAILNFFSSKSKPEPFKEDKKAELPPSEEPQIKKTVVRGTHGRFIAKNELKSGAKEETVPKEENPQADEPKEETVPKEEVQIPDAKMEEPITVTLYGKEIKKIYSKGKWYFAVDDLVATAASPDPDHGVKMRAGFDKAKKDVGKTIDNVVYADAKGCLLLITKVNGIFPGPITRWLTESAEIPYIPKPKDRTENN